MQSDVKQRRAQRQKQIRRRRIKFAFIIFLLTSIIVFAIMCFTIFFPIKRINISGSEIYSKEQIIKASELTTDDNIFVVSEKKIKKKIREKLPYVDDISLKRVLPDAIILTVTDAKEHMFFEKNEKYYIVSESNYILKEQSTMPDNIFQAVSSGMDGNIGESLIYAKHEEEILMENIIKALNRNKINIDRIDVSNALQITVNVEGRFVVVLGNHDYIEEKIAHMASMIESIGDRKGKINLSMWTPENSQGSFVENKS